MTLAALLLAGLAASACAQPLEQLIEPGRTRQEGPPNIERLARLPDADKARLAGSLVERLASLWRTYRALAADCVLKGGN